MSQQVLKPGPYLQFLLYLHIILGNLKLHTVHETNQNLHIHLADITVTIFNNMPMLAFIKNCFAFLSFSFNAGICRINCQCQ